MASRPLPKFFDNNRWGNRPCRLPMEALGAALQAMEKRGPRWVASSIEGEAQHGILCRIGRVGQGNERVRCRRRWADRARGEGGERTRGADRAAKRLAGWAEADRA